MAYGAIVNITICRIQDSSRALFQRLPLKTESMISSQPSYRQYIPAPGKPPKVVSRKIFDP